MPAVLGIIFASCSEVIGSSQKTSELPALNAIRKSPLIAEKPEKLTGTENLSKWPAQLPPQDKIRGGREQSMFAFVGS
jgi:hypothetical protein